MQNWRGPLIFMQRKRGGGKSDKFMEAKYKGCRMCPLVTDVNNQRGTFLNLIYKSLIVKQQKLIV